MSVAKIKKSSLWALLLVSLSSQTWAVYPDVGSMLDALAPTAPVAAPELSDLITAINVLPTAQQQLAALQTLTPSADGSLIAASEGPMRQMQMALFDRLIKVNPNSGISSGDEPNATEKPAQAQQQNLDVKENDTKEKVEKHKEAKEKETKEKEVKETAAKDKDAKDKDTSEQDEEEIKATEEPNTIPVLATAKIPAVLDKGVWIQLLANNTGQHTIGEVPGYDANVLGLLIGRDKLITPNFTLGVAAGYVHADVNSRGPSGSFLEIKRFQGTLYAGYHFTCPFFLNGALTFAKNDYDSNRKILVPPVGGVPFVRIAWGGFSAWETNAYLETGFNWVKGHFHAIPKVVLNYSHFDFEGYVEKDAFGLNLDVKYHNMNFFPCGVGLKLEYQNEFERAYVIPEIHAFAFHYFTKDPQTATAMFTGGGFEFLSQGVTPASNSYEVGAGIAVHSDLNMAVVIQYDYAARSDYHRNQAFIKVRYEWA